MGRNPDVWMGKDTQQLRNQVMLWRPRGAHAHWGKRSVLGRRWRPEAPEEKARRKEKTAARV